ncbi:MAG: glycine/sarcosine/betaine reductase selenoprotein B family protein [candidate division NC10 bacterium]
MTHVRYIDKTRDYYRNEGYDAPYRWAHFDEIPFTRLTKPLSACRVGLVTTSEMAMVGAPGAWDENDPARDVYSMATDTPVAKLYSQKEAYDRHATTLADVDSYLPLTRLAELAAAGCIKDVAPRFQVIYSQYSQRKTLTVDAPEILRQMREDRVDVAVLTAV